MLHLVNVRAGSRLEMFEYSVGTVPTALVSHALGTMLSWVLTLTPDPICLIVSRVFTGIAAAACYNVIPMYIKEISQDNMRGILGFTVMLAQNVGVLVIYLMGAYLDYHLVLWILTPIPVLCALLMLLAPESPVFISMSCVERFGRRLVVTLLISVVSFAGLAIIIMTQDAGGDVPRWLPVVVLVAGQFAFAAGVSSLPFIIVSEMFNFQIRAKMMGILAELVWFMTFVQLIVFGPVTSAFGAHVSFFVFAVVNLLAIVLTVTVLPETKGRNIERIENALIGKKMITRIQRYCIAHLKNKWTLDTTF